MSQTNPKNTQHTLHAHTYNKLWVYIFSDCIFRALVQIVTRHDCEYLELILQIREIITSTLKIQKGMTDTLLYFKSEVSLYHTLSMQF